MVSNASELLPEPDSPVITTRALRGRSRSIDLRLCSRAPRMRMNSSMVQVCGQTARGHDPRQRPHGIDALSTARGQEVGGEQLWITPDPAHYAAPREHHLPPRTRDLIVNQ